MIEPIFMTGTVICPFCNERQLADDAHIEYVGEIAVFECTECHQEFTEEDTTWRR